MHSPLFDIGVGRKAQLFVNEKCLARYVSVGPLHTLSSTGTTQQQWYNFPSWEAQYSTRHPKERVEVRPEHRELGNSGSQQDKV